MFFARGGGVAVDLGSDRGFCPLGTGTGAQLAISGAFSGDDVALADGGGANAPN